MPKPLVCLLAALVAIVVLRSAPAAESPPAVETPTTVDKRLAIELFAAEPQIVTPTGIAVDQQGRVLVIESHTHFRPPDYQGPPADRIRMLEDTDGDGRANHISTFFEGTRYTMNLAVDGAGGVYVATRSQVFRLRDNDGDGRADQRTEIARLETKGDYPHNGLSGFAFDAAGNVFFGLGENLGADYRLVGSDGSAATGGGEGGSIYRCSPDGAGLHRVATGFWNPFHLCFDAFGRLFAVDNDPDSRPPCRLLHIVDGGDYGYRYRNGRKGIHPFTAWNGEQPGTLPMTAGTGEAPSGVLAYESDGLPDDYRGVLVATSWGDHRIERFRLLPRGASFHAVAEPIITGGENFRPVGIALAPDGSLYVSDWVAKSYPLHGKGRVWHVRPANAGRPDRGVERVAARRADAMANPKHDLVSPHGPWREQAARRLAEQGEAGRAALRGALQTHNDPRVRATALAALAAAGDADPVVRQALLSDRSVDVRALAARIRPGAEAIHLAMAENQGAEVRAEAMRRVADRSARPTLLQALTSPDSFLRQAARQGLRQSSTIAALVADAEIADPRQRLEVVLTLREIDDAAARAILSRLLDDADPAIRFAAVQWIGERRLADFRDRLEAGLLQRATTRDLFEAHLTALEQLDGVTRTPKDEFSGEEYVLKVFLDPRSSPEIRARALRMLRPEQPALEGKLAGLLDGKYDERLRLEAVRTLRERGGDAAAGLLAQITGDTRAAVKLRAEAIVGLSPQNAQHRKLLLDLAAGNTPALRDEALRSLRGAELSADELARLDSLTDAGGAVKDLVALVAPRHNGNSDGGSGDSPGKSSSATTTPKLTRGEWLKVLDGPADAQAGERIYFHPRGPGCFRCHQIDGRGGRIGPDLSTVARVLSRERLIESLIEPSKEVAPQFVSFVTERTDGTTFTGLLVNETAAGQRTYADAQGKLITLAAAEIARSQPASASIMPGGLLDAMTRAEMRDLVAYLLAPR